MLARLDLELRKAPSLGRDEVATLMRIREQVLLIQAARACAPCATKTETWVSMKTSPPSDAPAPDLDVF